MVTRHPAPVGLGKYMKLSAVVLISVNLVAASQLPANADDTAAFLADALSSKPSARAVSAAPRAAQVKRSSPARTGSSRSGPNRSYVAMAPIVDGVKVRTFKPGRYLPSEAELSAKREAESASMYQSLPAHFDPSGTMAGSVSYSGERVQPSYPSAYQMPSYPMPRGDFMPKITAAVQKAKQVAKQFAASPRAVPGMNAVLPGQIAQAAKGIVPEPSSFNAMPVQVPQPGTTASLPVQVAQPQPTHSNVAAPYMVPPPSLTNYEQSRLQRIVDSNMPGNVYNQGFNGDMRANQGNPGLAGAGPSPFPLSVNPMQGRMGGNAMSPGAMPIGQQARFGSWHGGSSNLASAGFHTYVPVHMSGPASIKVNHSHGSRKTGRQANKIASHHTHSSYVAPQAKHAAATKAQVIEPKAASYPPYMRY